MDEKNKKCCNRRQAILLDLLDNSDIQEKILDIFLKGLANVIADRPVSIPGDKSDKSIENIKPDFKDQIEKLKKDKSELEQRLQKKEEEFQKQANQHTDFTNKIKEDFTNEINKIKDNKQGMEKELRDCQDKLETTKKDLAGATEKLRATSELEEKYKLYKTLPDNLRRSLAGIVNGESFASFLISGSQESRRENFWEFCRTEVQKSNGLTYAETLKTLFVFFHNNAMSITSSPMYELYEPESQSKYSGDAMIPSNSGEQSGHVVQVVLPGIRAIKSGNIVKKAIVKLEE